MFGRPNDKNRENRDLTRAIAQLRNDLSSARKNAANIADDRDMWQRRAIEYADRLTTVETGLRQAKRDLTARDQKIRALHVALAAHGEPDDDRASQPAVPLPADLELARRNRELHEHNLALQQLLDDYQAREEHADWRFADLAGATPAVEPAA